MSETKEPENPYKIDKKPTNTYLLGICGFGAEGGI